MNPEGALSSPFDKNKKRDVLHKINEYLLSNGYDPENLGLLENELFDKHYEKYMQLIKVSCKIVIDGKETLITPRSLDNIEARIWYKVQEYKFVKFIQEKFGIDIDPNHLENLNRKEKDIVAFHLYHFRNFYRVKTRYFMADIKKSEGFMREDPCKTLLHILIEHKGISISIIEASMRGRFKFDRFVKDALKNNWISSKSNRFYREWCIILGVDYRELLGFI
jgi:hypothetical protein